MIYLTLPNFYENFRLNNFLTTMIRYHSDWVKEKTAVIQTSGQFSYCYWNGGINRNVGRGAYYDDIANCAIKNMVPLRLNCANIDLQEMDFDDTLGNVILELNHNGSNLIEISNLNLMDYIKERYPNYKFVFSKEADLITPFSAELLNNILATGEFSLIGLPNRFTDDMEFLKNLTHRNQIELTVNPMCPQLCKSYNECAISEHNSQKAYSGISPILSCKRIKKPDAFTKIKDLTELKDKYGPLGITHFTFSPYFATKELLQFYINFIFKEEYINQIYQEINRFPGGVI